MADSHRVFLDNEQRAYLRTVVGSGTPPARMFTRARVLLTADHGDVDPVLLDRVAAEDFRPVLQRQSRQRFLQCLLHCAELAGREASGPIGPEHDAVDAKDIETLQDIGTQVGRGPIGPAGFPEHA